MKKWFLLILVIMLPISIFLALSRKNVPRFTCLDAIGCVTIAPDEPLRLGVIQDLSGRAASFGTEQLRSIELALSERDNQLLNHPIALHIEDEKCSPESGSVAASKLATDSRIAAILGTTCSGVAARVNRIISEAGLVMISGANSAPSLTSVGGERGEHWQPGYFRTIYNSVETGGGAATFAFRELGVRKAATINDGDSYTRGYAEAFGRAFTESGGELVLEAVINKGEANMRPVLTALVYSGAEFIFLPLFETEMILLMQQAREIEGLAHTIFLAGPNFTEHVLHAIGQDGIGMYVLNTMTPLKTPGIHKIVTAFEARYGEPPQVAGFDFAYDSANLLVHAIEAVAVREKDGTIHLGRQALRDTLYGITDFPGITGRLSCNEFGDCGVPRFTIVRLDHPEAGLDALKSNVIYSPAHQADKEE